MTVNSVALVCGPGRGPTDGIARYSERMCAALVDHAGVRAEVVRRDQAAPLLSQLSSFDCAVVQYNPFSFGRWGFAPGLVLDAARVARREQIRLAVLVHEPFVDIDSPRSLVMGAWQRGQLRALCRLADRVATTIEPWQRRLRKAHYKRRVERVPVGSNLPLSGLSRGAARARLGLDDETITFATLSTGHPSHLLALVGDALEAIAASDVRCALLVLGDGARPALEAGTSIDQRTFGHLPEHELADALRAADVFLAPFVDGVSTRRTSVMAALQHALPVVGTAGPLSDQMLVQATDEMVLTPVGRPADFTAAALRLAGDPNLRRRIGNAGAQLFERSFGWPVLAHGLVEAVLSP